MTLKKSVPPRGYETFSSNSSEAGATTPHTQSTSDSQKTGSAAEQALRLATQGSWGDNYLSGTPITNATPTASTVDETEDRYGDRRYPTDPPPQYTPTDTIRSPTTPSSPNTVRQQPEPVRQPSSPLHPSPPPAEESAPDQDEDGLRHGPGTPSSPLLESAQPVYHSNDVNWSRDKCKSHRHRRWKKACWFTFALLLCLWLMIPALFHHNRARTRVPRPITDPLDQSPIPSFPKPSREYHQHETSRSIHGTYQLYDLLDLSTVSGSISITVNPQTGDKPAVLRLAAASGSISVRMGDTSWSWGPRQPHSISTNRTFETSITSKSGTVSGSILHGNGGKTDISTRSGSISLTINTIGVGTNDSTSKLSTSTNSGSQNVAIKSFDTVRAVEARHIVYGSGSLNIDYPSSWEGMVHAKSGGSGSVQVDGSGLEYQGGGRDVYAQRGNGDLKGVEVLGTGSGSVSFRC